ncbi:MAG TPA: tripartite tricarboxylate transporter substrate-binding protein [Burkholderiales bacterium]|nr:tripartite tricarboxylate transporter substrate-binding protein [Burkholderiales bacterium]
MRIVVLGLLAVLCTPFAFAANYPEKPVRLVIPFVPGGNIDITARAIGPSLSKALGQPVVYDNRGGAGGTIGGEHVARSAPDGYTLLLGSTGLLTLAPALYPKTPYDPVKDFAAIGSVSDVPVVLVVHPSLPVKNVKELIALARARPGQITVARAGLSLAGELFKIQTKVDMIIVNYKGGAAAVRDLLGGHVHSMFDQLSSATPHIRDGKVRALAVTTPKRAALFPEIPTLEESGVKGANASTYSGMLAPAGTPREIVAKLNAALVSTLGQKEVQERFAALGATVWPSTPEQFAAVIRNDLATWTRVIKAANIKPE